MSSKIWTPEEINAANAEFWEKQHEARPMNSEEVKKEKEELKERKAEWCRKNPELARRIPDYAWEKSRRYAELKHRYPDSFMRQADLVVKLQRLGVADDPGLAEETDISAPVSEIELLLSAGQREAASNPRPKKGLTIRNRVIEIMRRERRKGVTRAEFVRNAVAGMYWDDDGVRMDAYKDDLADQSGIFDVTCESENAGRKISGRRKTEYDKDGLKTLAPRFDDFGNPVEEISFSALDKKWWNKAGK